MIFDSLEDLKFFLRDYSVRHHRPYDVVHSSAKLRYTVRCQQGCPCKVWAYPVVDDRVKWRISNIKQPHTCFAPLGDCMVDIQPKTTYSI